MKYQPSEGAAIYRAKCERAMQTFHVDEPLGHVSRLASVKHVHSSVYLDRNIAANDFIRNV